jgi:ActR/RegA family two-component response regulator
MLTTNKDRIGGRPCLVLAHADEVYGMRACRSFRSMGWEAHQADTGAEARSLARQLCPNLVILDTQLDGESGWLTCDKLTREMPRLKVLLLGYAPPAQGNNFAEFVGATALIDRLDGLLAILHEFADQVEPAVG